MKKTIIYISLIFLSLYSCNADKQNDIREEFITSIENNLLPKIILEGKETQGYNLLDRMEHYNVPGVSIAFMDKGQIQWARGYGYADIENKRKVDANTLFQAASISKPLAAMAALSLVEQGKIELDNDVNQYLKGWQVEENDFTTEEKITLRRLLSHSAGLTVHGFGGYSKSDSIPGILDILNGEGTANSGRIYPNIAPGTTYRYSGGGYTVMQKMLTDICEKNFPEIMDELVLSKIGMTSSTYLQPLPAEKYNLAAFAYRGDRSMVEGGWHTYPEMAAAGLWTTPGDLLKYALEVQKSLTGKSNKVLSAKMIEEMLSPVLNNHGLGPAVGGEGEFITFSHGGANEGYRCQLYIFTLQGQGVAIMTNSSNGGALYTEILRSFSKVLEWPTYKPKLKSVISLSPEKLEEFAGRYVLKLGDQDLIVELTAGDNHVRGLQLWDDFTFEIYPEDKDLFFGLHDGVPFNFQRNDKDKISGIIIHEGPNTYNFKKIE